MVNVTMRNMNSFIVEDGIIKVYCHIENKRLWIDKIEIHGSIESTELRIRLRKIHKYLIEKHGTT